MKLMKRIILIFVTVTLISTIAYYVVGQSIINEASSGEIDRGVGRTNSMISRLESEGKRIAAQSKEFGEYINMAIKIDRKYGEGEQANIVDIDEKLQNINTYNMLLLDNNFKLLQTLEIKDIDINSKDLEQVYSQVQVLMNKEKNKRKEYVGGIIDTEEMPYIVGVKEITALEDKSIYIMVIKPMNDEYIKSLGKTSERDLGLVRKDSVNINDEDVEMSSLYGRKSYCIRTEDSIDVLTEINTITNENKYYLRLKDDREVRKTTAYNINLLIIIIILMTIVVNILLYILIKNKVLKRIIKINRVVNEVTEGQNLEVNLVDSGADDEISVLTSDLNNMFNTLKVYSDNLEYLGSHDILTSLYNRHKLSKFIEELEKNNKEFEVFFIDLDNFKGINDTLGHKVGDEILCEVATELIKYSENPRIKVSRIGGDEFIILREGKNDEVEIDKFATNVLSKINRIYEINNYSYEIKASMGISFYPTHTNDEVTLLQYADIAMYRSKRNGGNEYTIFDKSMLEPLEIESKLRSGIENNEFKVYYQPIYGIEGDNIIGAEALTRWETKDGIVPPYKFISLAKKTGDIVEIDKLVLQNAIATCREWIDKGKKDFYISVNASKQFLKQKDIVDLIKEELKKANVPSKALKIEITEDEIIDDVEYTINLLEKIREIGVKVSLDDFGVGYSSFNHIKVLPLDVIKIDRSLIMNIQEDPKTKSIVETMIRLCESLSLRVVCEGVEELEQVKILKELGCHSIQGYYFSKPLPRNEFDKFMEEF